MKKHMQIPRGRESLAYSRESLKPDQIYNLLSEYLKTLVLPILLIQKNRFKSKIHLAEKWQVFTEIYKYKFPYLCNFLLIEQSKLMGSHI